MYFLQHVPQLRSQRTNRFGRQRSSDWRARSADLYDGPLLAIRLLRTWLQPTSFQSSNLTLPCDYTAWLCNFPYHFSWKFFLLLWNHFKWKRRGCGDEATRKYSYFIFWQLYISNNARVTNESRVSLCNCCGVNPLSLWTDNTFTLLAADCLVLYFNVFTRCNDPVSNRASEEDIVKHDHSSVCFFLHCNTELSLLLSDEIDKSNRNITHTGL